MKYDIFISYRREGGYDTAKHLNDLLVRDGYKVSFDIDTLRNGDFDTQLLSRIEGCKDFILIIDQHCFDRTLDSQFDPKKDWLRCELAHALKHKKNIIPIFLKGVNGFPDNLPDDIVAVVRRNGPLFDHYYFDAFYDKLKRMFLESQPSNQTDIGNNTSLTSVRIYPDTDCDIYLFGQKIGTAIKGEYYELNLPKGENALKFISTTDNTISSDEIVNIDEYQRIVKVSLNPPRIVYTTTDGRELILSEEWNSKISRHTYANGKGVIVCNEIITSIEDRAFCDCSSLANITIPNSVTSIGESAFRRCSSLASITIPNSVTSIGESAFEGCSSLKYVTIPDSVTSIGDCAFDNCSSLKSITIPDSVTSIEDRAFCDCSSLANITIPDSVTSIGRCAFCRCSNLANITIPDSVTSIGNCAFDYCSSLKSITIPDSVTFIGHSAFEGCSSLASITIGNGVTSIGDFTFCDCSNLKSVTIPDSVTSIGNCAFDYCSSLKSITIPDSVTFIGHSAFEGCSSLKYVTISDSVTSIWDWAFRGCSSLKYVTIPDSVTFIGNCAFEGCSSLASIYCKAATPPKVGSSFFDGLGLEKNVVICVPGESVEAYKSALHYKEYTIIGV